jgi:hypothetical protein
VDRIIIGPGRSAEQFLHSISISEHSLLPSVLGAVYPVGPGSDPRIAKPTFLLPFGLLPIRNVKHPTGVT